MMDYRDLLKRYMTHVGYMEGTDFVISLPSYLFTPEEIAELNALSDESTRDEEARRVADGL